MIGLRHQIHQHPELANRESETSKPVFPKRNSVAGKALWFRESDLALILAPTERENRLAQRAVRRPAEQLT
jgi:hypothetical protein